MKTYQLPKGALGIDHHSGASYRARSNGRVDLPDSVAHDFERNGALRHYDVIAPTAESIGAGRVNDILCSNCGFAPWDWQTDCSRCGEKIARKEINDPVRA